MIGMMVSSCPARRTSGTGRRGAPAEVAAARQFVTGDSGEARRHAIRRRSVQRKQAVQQWQCFDNVAERRPLRHFVLNVSFKGRVVAGGFGGEFQGTGSSCSTEDICGTPECDGDGAGDGVGE